MSDFFKTIKSPSEGLYKEKMSRFISLAFPVSSADEAKGLIKKIQNEYHDARHVCWAFMIGTDCTEFYSSDNGEPSGTAGKPILGQINSFGLTNILIIVVRYFGGIKLGTPGLIAAYRAAASQAIGNAEIIECHEQSELSFSFPYLSVNDVMKIIKSDGEITVLSQNFDNSCSISLQIRSDMADSLKRQLSEIDGVTML